MPVKEPSFPTSPLDFAPIEFIDLGIGAVIALLLIDRFISFARVVQARGKNSGKYVTEMRVDHACTRIKELYMWHNIRDENGVMRWYTPSGLVPMMEDLKRAVEELTREVGRMNDGKGAG